MRKGMMALLAVGAVVGFSGGAGAQTTASSVGSVVARSSLPTSQAIVPATVPLTASGGTLLFSDAPEEFNVSAAPGTFYRDTATGSFRVFWHHQNVGSSPAEVALVLTNTTNASELVFSSGVGVAQNFYPDQAGQSALTQFLTSEGPMKLVARLAPQQSYWLTEPADLTTYNGKIYGNTVSGMAQFTVVQAPASVPSPTPSGLSAPVPPSPHPGLPGEPAGTVTVTNLAYQGTAPQDPLTVPVLVNHANTVRGTFPFFRRTGVVNVNLADGAQSLAIESAVSGPYSSALPGEYELGQDVVDGAQVYDDGNYGVTYDLAFHFTNLGEYRSVAIYDVPAGGAGHYAVEIHHQVLDSPYLTYQDAWEIADQNVGPASTLSLKTALPGGADGPQVLFIVPSMNSVTPTPTPPGPTRPAPSALNVGS